MGGKSADRGFRESRSALQAFIGRRCVNPAGAAAHGLADVARCGGSCALFEIQRSGDEISPTIDEPGNAFAVEPGYRDFAQQDGLELGEAEADFHQIRHAVGRFHRANDRDARAAGAASGDVADSYALRDGGPPRFRRRRDPVANRKDRAPGRAIDQPHILPAGARAEHPGAAFARLNPLAAFDQIGGGQHLERGIVGHQFAIDAGIDRTRRSQRAAYRISAFLAQLACGDCRGQDHQRGERGEGKDQACTAHLVPGPPEPRILSNCRNRQAPGRYDVPD